MAVALLSPVVPVPIEKTLDLLPAPAGTDHGLKIDLRRALDLLSPTQRDALPVAKRQIGILVMEMRRRQSSWRPLLPCSCST